MWLWQRKKPISRISIVGIVGGVHILGLLIVFGAVHRTVYRVRMQEQALLSTGAVVQIVPGRVRPQLTSGAGRGSGRASAGHTQRQGKKGRKKVKAATSAQRKQGALPIAQNVQPSTHHANVARQKKNKKQAKKVKKQVQMPEKAALQPLKKGPKTPPLEVPPSDDIQPTPVQEVVHKKADVSPEVPTENTAHAEEPTREAEDGAPDNGEPIYIGQEVYDEYMLAGRVQQAVLRYWRRPIGFSAELLCEVAVQITAHGKAASVVIQKSSGVLVYDMAARTAALKAEYPRELWNKTLLLQF